MGGEIDNFLNNPYVDTTLNLIPIVGTLKSGYDFIHNPTLANLGDLGVSLITEVPFLKAFKIAKAVKTAKTIRTAKKATIKSIKRSGASKNSPINIQRELDNVNFVENMKKTEDKYNKMMNITEIGIGSSIDLGNSIYKNYDNFKKN